MKYPRKILNYVLLHEVLKMSHLNKESLFAIVDTYDKKVQEGDIHSEAAHPRDTGSVSLGVPLQTISSIHISGGNFRCCAFALIVCVKKSKVQLDASHSRVNFF